MNERELLDKIYQEAKKFKNKKIRSLDDEFDVHDWSGGNIDDAFQLGYNDGEAEAFQCILKMIEKETEKETV